MSNKHPFISVIQQEGLFDKLFSQYSDARGSALNFNKVSLKTSLLAAYKQMVVADKGAYQSQVSYGFYGSVSARSYHSALNKAAVLGLDLDPAKQESYIALSPNEEKAVDLIIGVQGYNKLISHSSKVLSSAFDIIREGDTFTWFGEDESPSYSHNPNNGNAGLMGAFARFRLNNSTYKCTYIDKNEINNALNIRQQQARELGNNDDPWLTFPTKCLKHYTMRRSFKENQYALDFIPADIVIDEEGVLQNTQRENVSDIDLNAMLESISNGDNENQSQEPNHA